MCVLSVLKHSTRTILSFLATQKLLLRPFIMSWMSLRDQKLLSAMSLKISYVCFICCQYFDKHICPSRRKLPECLCFDETYAFKSRDSDYVCVLLDYTDKKIVDVLPSRRIRYLMDYFYKIPLKERKMWNMSLLICGRLIVRFPEWCFPTVSVSLTNSMSSRNFPEKSQE